MGLHLLDRHIEEVNLVASLHATHELKLVLSEHASSVVSYENLRRIKLMLARLPNLLLKYKSTQFVDLFSPTLREAYEVSPHVALNHSHIRFP